MFFARSFGFEKFEIKNSLYTWRVSDDIHFVLQFHGFDNFFKLIKERKIIIMFPCEYKFVKFLYKRKKNISRYMNVI